MKSPWLWAAVLGAGYLLFASKAMRRTPAPQYGDLPPPPDVYGVDEYGMPKKPGKPIADEGAELAEQIWGYSKVPTLDQLQRMNLGRGY